MGEGHCYIAVESCGCVTGIVADTDTGHITAEELSKDVAEFVKSGRRLERVTLVEGKVRFMEKCQKHK